MSTKFRNLPEPPAVPGVADLSYFQKVKYNMEILMGQREKQSAAILRSDVKLLGVPDPKLVRLKTGQQGVLISGSTVPTLAEYNELQKDLETLREDVTVLRVYMNSLLQQLRKRER